MIAKQTLYLAADRQQVVAEGDPKAQFLLVRAGQEIADKELAKYDGAADLAGSASGSSDDDDESAPKRAAKSAKK